MANPNTLLTAVRFWLCKKLEPLPDPGEGWCISCSLNDGETQIISASAMEAHCRLHTPDEMINVITISPGNSEVRKSP